MNNRIIHILFCTLVLLVGCTSEQHYDGVDDIAHRRIGVLGGESVKSAVSAQYPDAEVRCYDKPLTLFLEIEADKCDAAIVSEAIATQLLTRNGDYGSLGVISAGEDLRMTVIVPESMIATDNAEAMGEDGWWGSIHDKVHRNLFAKDAFRLILGGLYTTVVIFIFAAILAVLLAALFAYMKVTGKLKWLFGPICLIVKILHEIPSVVLMMFFYYVVFAGAVHGTLVSIIALGIYASEPLANIFKVHIEQVGKDQFEAARMLGMTPRQSYRYVVLPQAVNAMLPLVADAMKSLLRSTSYAGYIAQKDLVKAVDAIRGLTYDAFVPLLIISLLYLILSWMIGKGLKLLYAKLFIHDRTVTHI